MKLTTVLAPLALLLVAPLSFADTGSELDTDFDGDGIITRDDNCYLYTNPSQLDTDNDGFGNACDPDLNNDGVVNFKDLGLLTDAFFSNDPNADFNEDGVVNFLDFQAFRRGFNNGRPGPAIIMHWVGDSGYWSERTNWFPQQIPSIAFDYAVIDTPESVVVTVAEDTVATTENLNVSGTLVVCGSLWVRELAVVTGSLTKECESGSVELGEGLDLGGQFLLKDGTILTSAIRKIDGTTPSVTAQGGTLDSFDFPSSVTTNVDITIKPGATLSAIARDVVIEDATLLLQSEENLPSTLTFGLNLILTGSGSLDFEGPNSGSARGSLITLDGTLAVGTNSHVNLKPGANAYLRSRIVNEGAITVPKEASLSFQRFNVVTNSGVIDCSENGELIEFEDGSASPGDSVLINNPTGVVSANNCRTTWPVRVVNQGSYQIANSDLVFPLIAANGVELEIANSDIHIPELVTPLAPDFYLFAPKNNNTVLMNGVFDLFGSTLRIDAAKWRFPQNDFARFEFGTLESTTPLTVNSDAQLTFFQLNVDTNLEIEAGAQLSIDVGTELNGNLNFIEPEDCSAVSTALSQVTLNTTLPALSKGFFEINAIGSSTDSCLTAKLSTPVANNRLPTSLKTTVTNASLQLSGENQGSIELSGPTEVSGANAELDLQQVVLGGSSLNCSGGATLRASGTEQRPFVNEQQIFTSNCDVYFTEHWRNNGTVQSGSGTFALSGPEDRVFIPGSGQFVAIDTQFFFDFDISDPSQLDVFKLIPTGEGSFFSFEGSFIDVGDDINTSDLPGNTVFADGFELSDTRITGSPSITLNGTTTLRNVILDAPAVVASNGTLNIFDQLELNSTLTIRSDSTDTSTSMTQVLMNGVSKIAGSGSINFEATGDNAVSRLIQNVPDMPLAIDSGIALSCYGGGLCMAQAGSRASRLDIFGSLSIFEEQSQMRFNSSATIYNSINFSSGTQLFLSDGTQFKLSGVGPAFFLDVISDMMEPAVVAEGSATVDISDAALFFAPAGDYVLESGATVNVLSHEGDAQRIGEFADVSGAQIEGQLFTPDYSSLDVTLFRGPVFE